MRSPDRTDRKPLPTTALVLGLALLLVIMPATTGCAYKKKVKPVHRYLPQTGFIFGHVDVVAAQPITSVIIRRYDDIEGRHPIGAKTFVYPGGNFAIVNIPPGQYVLAGYRAGKVIYPAWGSDEQPSGDVLRISADGLTYVGSFRITPSSDEGTAGLRYRVQKMAEPGEKSLLMFFRKTEAATGWRDIIQRRIDELN